MHTEMSPTIWLTTLSRTLSKRGFAAASIKLLPSLQTNFPLKPLFPRKGEQRAWSFEE
jgi:hypothetical protein